MLDYFFVKAFHKSKILQVIAHFNYFCDIIQDVFQNKLAGHHASKIFLDHRPFE
jgi:hypothetical protein